MFLKIAVYSFITLKISIFWVPLKFDNYLNVWYVYFIFPRVDLTHNIQNFLKSFVYLLFITERGFCGGYVFAIYNPICFHEKTGVSMQTNFKAFKYLVSKNILVTLPKQFILDIIITLENKSVNSLLQR